MSAGALRVAGLCGSLRAGSYNAAALRLALASLPEGTRTETLDIRDVPAFDADVRAREVPAAVARLSRRLREAQGLVIASPEYNFSVPGVLKNAIDWLSREDDAPLRGMPVAILSASTGPLGGARMQYDLRKVLLFVDARTLVKPEVFIGGSASKFTTEGECIDEATRKVVAAQMAALSELMRVNEWA